MASHLRVQKNDYLRLALTLFVVAALVGTILSVVHFFTEPIVENSAEKRLNQSFLDMMGEESAMEAAVDYSQEIVLGKVHIPIDTIYLAKDSSGNLIGYCVNVKPVGYSGIIDMLVGLDGEGAVKDVEILSMTETSGVGTKIKTNKAFRASLIGLTDSAKIVTHTPKPKDEVQVISGATISSTAYINGVNAAIEAVQILRAKEVLK